MRNKPLNRFALCALLALALAWSVGAQAKHCNVTGGAVAFGAVNPTPPGNLDRMGSVSIDCDGKFSAVLTLGVGTGAGASYAGGRRMTRTSGGGTLTYNLYANAARTQVLGDGTGGSVTLDLSGQKTYVQTIWARMPGSQLAVMAGSYADTIVVTVSW